MVARKTYNSSPADSLFDGDYYLSLNPDVATAGIDPYQHYLSFGWQEGRNPSPLFDEAYYLSQNPDVAAAGINPLLHFETFGWKEGRNPSPLFDEVYYLSHNPDVAAAGINPLLHFETFGWKEGRNPNAFFDTAYYLSKNPDVAAAGVDPLVHFEVFGWKEGRNPSPLFSVSKYLAANPDVAVTGVDPLVHFLEFGIKEGRPPIPLNRPPIANDEGVATRSGVPLRIRIGALLANDFDPDGDNFAYAGYVPINKHGTIREDGDALIYTADIGFVGKDSFEYAIDDQYGARSYATVTIEVEPNTVVAVDDTFTVHGTKFLRYADLTSNDYDPQGDFFQLVGIGSGPSHGTFQVTQGLITYTPDTGYVGTDSFQYTIQDLYNATSTATVTFNVEANTVVAVDDEFAVQGAKSLRYSDLTSNDYDPQGDAFQLVGIGTRPSHGTLQGTQDRITYTPDAGYVGTDSFQYTIQDLYNATSTATVTLNVGGNTVVAVDDEFAVHGTTFLRYSDLTSNDYDPQGDFFQLVGIGTGPSHGTLQGTQDRITYTPDAGYVGTDSFQYTIQDLYNATSTATVTFNVEANTVVAVDDEFAVQGVKSLRYSDLTSNDYDLQGDFFQLVGISRQPTHGRLNTTVDGITYTADPGYVGTDTFQYAIQDLYNAVAYATVTLDVTQFAPVLASVAENQPAGTLVASLAALDPDPMDPAVTLSLVGNSALLFKLDGNQLVTRGTLDYETAQMHSLQVQATEAGGNSLIYTVNVSVTDAPDVLPFGGISSITNTGANGTAGTAGIGSGVPASAGGIGGAGSAGGGANASFGQTIWAGDASYQNVLFSRTATAGASGSGGNGSSGYSNAYTDTQATNGGITQTYRTYSGTAAGMGGAGGAAGMGSDARVVLDTQLVALGGRATGQTDTARFTANAYAGTGARGGTGGNGAAGADAQDVTSFNTRFTTPGVAGGGGADGAAGGNGGAAVASIDGMVLSSSGLQLTLDANAVGGTGGNGGYGGNGGDGSSGGTGGRGAAGGAGGVASAAITGLDIGGQTAVNLTLNLTAEGGGGGRGGGAGFGGRGRTITNTSTAVTRADNGVAAKGGDAGAASARLADGLLVFGDARDVLQVNARVTAGSGGSPGAGVEAVAAISQTGFTDTGRTATPDGARGANGTATIEVTGNRIETGGGTDLVQFNFSAIGASGDPISAAVIFQNNTLDGGEGNDRLEFTMLNDLRIDTRAGSLAIDGSPANSLLGFESFAGGQGSNTFIDGAGDYEYFANGLASDAFYFAPGSGNDVIAGFTSGQDSLHLEGFASSFGMDVATFLATHLSTNASGAAVLDLTTLGGALSQITFNDGDRPLATDVFLI